jgi:uncharacterized YigZ family protein
MPFTMQRLAAAVSAEIEVRKSRFIGYLHPLQTRAEAMSALVALRAQHPNAAHVCWVLLVDGDSGLDDDGEPAGTAARPMYQVLMHKDLHNLLAVVVRYWGGIKLGAGGLARAYGRTISETVQLAHLLPVEATCKRRFVLPFAAESALRRHCQQAGVVVLDAQYGAAVTLVLDIKLRQLPEFCRGAADLLRGALEIHDELD